MTDEGNPVTDDQSVGLKELQVCVTDINLVQPDVSNGTSVKRGRGRPKGPPKNANVNGENSPKKRGRPKSSLVNAGDMNSGSAKRLQGSSKDSVVRNVDSSVDESENSFSPPRKKGRPKGSYKKPEHNSDSGNDTEEVQSAPKRGRPAKSPAKGKRGRPKKTTLDGEKTHKSPGRPKGSRNKPVIIVRVESTSGRISRAPDKLTMPLPRKYPGKRGRPKKSSRGRPRKTPLPPEEELYVPRVWKALGRPRKYPKEEHPDQVPAHDTPRRGRGRPRKSESKKGAHLRKLDSDGSSRKPGRPKATKEQDGSQRKRGRPKGSFKNKAHLNKVPHDSDQSMESAPPEEHLSNDQDMTVE